MKNFYKYISIIAVMGAFVSCDPITDTYTIDDSTISADGLQLSVAPKFVDGKNGNIIVVENNSPILSEWSVGESVARKAYAELSVSFIGQHTVNFRGLNSNGQTFTETSFTVKVDTISTIPTDIANRLCIGQEGAPTYFGTTIDMEKIEFSNEEDLVTVKNGNPVLTVWSCGGVTSDKNVAQMRLTCAGEFPLSATFTLANGEQVTKELGTVIVRNFNLPQIVLDLVGEDGEKTWTWQDNNFYGLGGYNTSTYPDWFVFDRPTMSMIASYIGMAGEETGSMILNIDGNFSVAPTGRTGTFSYDFDDTVPSWSVGKLHVNGSILFGWAFDGNTQAVSYQPTDFYIVKCDANNLVLAALSEAGGSIYDYASCTFWRFKPKPTE